MKITTWWIKSSLAGALVLVGCSKSTPAVQPPVVQGVTIDFPKLRDAFIPASPEVQACLAQITRGVRYKDYQLSLAALDKLARTPGLTQPQEKIVSEVTAQMKELASKSPAAPAR